MLISGATPLTRGKVLEKDLSDTRRQVQPRLRGEKEYVVEKSLRILGATPLTRGKVDIGILSDICSRVQPRLRGEKIHLPAPQLGRPGATPLTRGKGDGSAEINRNSGCNPAYAGKR